MFQVKGLKQKCQLQETVLKKFENEETSTLAADESNKCNAVAKFIKSIEVQVTLIYGLYRSIICSSRFTIMFFYAARTCRFAFPVYTFKHLQF